MRSLYSRTLAALFVFGVAGPATAQEDVYTLGFSGPDSIVGVAGSTVGGSAACTLTHEGPGEGAQGYSIGVALEGAVMVGATVEGTTTGELYDSGFNKTGVVDPELNGGQQGATSAIVLCFGCPAVLPAEATLLALDFDVTIPEESAEPAVVTLRYVDGLIGEGQPVQTVVSQQGRSFAPVRDELEIPIVVTVSCLEAPYALGFSAERLLATEAYAAGLLGTGELGHPSGAALELAAGAGEIASGRVWANVSSNDADGGVQGWSLSIEALGDAAITDITTDDSSGAPVPDGRYDSGFGKTELATAEVNGGRSGAVTAIVLCFGCGATLAPVGTESVAQLMVESKAAVSEEAPQSGALVYSPLQGSGQIVQNVLTVAGTSAPVCNIDFARLDIDFALKLGIGPLIRGDANDDTKVDIADGIWIINELFREGTPSPCQVAADANADDLVDLADAVFIFGYRFLGGAAPSAPFPECGFVELDSTPLDCVPGSTACQ